MRIGLIVDGVSEYRSLQSLLVRIQTNATLLRPLFADIQPLAPKGQLVRAVKPGLSILAGKRVDLALILLDLEGRDVCPGAWANELTTTLRRDCRDSGIKDVNVVIKNRCYENWLVGDPEAFAKIPKLFQLSLAHRNSIGPGKADAVDGLKILKAAAQKTPYDKVNDAIKIAPNIDPRKLGANSRSFRRLLRLLGDPQYANQSSRP